MLTKYGYTTIGYAVLLALVLLVLSFIISVSAVQVLLIILALFVIVFTLNFFRDPERKIPQGDNIIVSPADGKVLIVKDVIDKKYIGEEATQVSIFMSPLNVHVNRIPIDGKVEYLKYVEGEYLVAYHDKADERNERSEIGILSKFGKVFYTQVAGMVARRIIYDLKSGESVKKGERFGMIKFGSRVDVVVPKKWNLKVKEGDMATAGETILFELSE